MKILFIPTTVGYGQKQEQIWTKALNFQMKKYEKILNSNNVLIRSFLGLFFLSLLKIFIGIFNSESLLAEGFENFLDCIAVILIGIGIRFKKERSKNYFTNNKQWLWDRSRRCILYRKNTTQPNHFIWTFKS